MKVPVGKSVVNQQPCDAFNPFLSVRHPVCVADESGLRLGKLRDIFGGEFKANTNTRCPGWARLPSSSASFFCSKGTKMVLVVKVVFLLLSKCGPDTSLCSCRPCAGVLKPLCTEVPSSLEEKRRCWHLNSWCWLPAIGHNGPACLQRAWTLCWSQSVWWSISAAVASSADLRLFSLLSCSFARSFEEQTGLKGTWLQNNRGKLLSTAIK